MQSSSNKIALVTGANKDIGFEVAGRSGTGAQRGHAILDALTICSDGRRSLLTLLANADNSRMCSSFWLQFAESRQSTRLISRCFSGSDSWASAQ
jgi:NAD(P)-dependent dehydrogenase (short-subunit alcohol dehydrogenase family)